MFGRVLNTPLLLVAIVSIFEGENMAELTSKNMHKFEFFVTLLWYSLFHFSNKKSLKLILSLVSLDFILIFDSDLLLIF